MDISVVVSTRDRARQLTAALPHYMALSSIRDWEAIFVNNGSTDATGEVLADFVRAMPGCARLIEELKPGVSAGRNSGWREARGDIIVFLDDDCYPVPDFLNQIWLCFADPTIDYLGGRVLLYDSKDCPITIKESREREEIPPKSFVRPGIILGANMAFRRRVLEHTGGFDEKLGPGATVYGEELDLMARASGLGYRGAFDPRPVVYHHHRRSAPGDVQRLMHIYDMGRGAYYAKCLMGRRTCRAYLWPVVRRVIGNICRGDFGVLWREIQGALKYVAG